jgi:hypothetical protein
VEADVAYVTDDECKTYRTICPLVPIVMGEHGLANEHEEVKKAIQRLENRLTRIEVLIPFVTALIIKLMDWGLARIATAAAAQH